MKKIYLMLMSATLISLVACGEEKKEDKKDKAESEEETEEPKKEEAPVDYSYVLPQIDTAALTTESEILTAMEKVVVARKLDDSLSEAAANYDGYYTELTNLYSVLTSKASSYAMTLKGKEAMAFNEKLFAITDKLYK